LELKHSFEDLLKVVYQYYPRASLSTDPEGADFWQTEEHRRLVDARIRAGTEDGPWRAMLDRLRARFPNAVENRSVQLQTGGYDGAYTGILTLPTVAPLLHTLTFMVSFLAPYYIIYGARWVAPPPTEDDAEEEQEVEVGETPESERIEERFELTDEEAPYAQAISTEIEATFGAQPIPPAMGRRIVPDASRDGAVWGTAPLFHYLFASIVPTDVK